MTPLATVTGHPDGKLAMALPLLPTGMQALAGPPSLHSCTRDVYPPQLRLSRATAHQVLAQIGSAVQHLHNRGVLHDDLYAHNILWNPDTGEALLSDLGAAVLTDELPQDQVHALQQIELRALDTLRQELLAIAH